MSDTNIVQFLYEMGTANYVFNTGWQLINIDHSNNVSLAEHSFRNAIIAFIIAILENENANKCAIAGLLHKTHKIRLGDQHKVSANYFDYPSDIKDRVRKDQFLLLGEEVASVFEKIFDLTEKEKIIVKDADQIEFALEAKSLLEKGHTRAQIWLDRIAQVLQTNSARKIFNQLLDVDSTSWWEGLKKAPRVRKKDYIAKI